MAFTKPCQSCGTTFTGNINRRFCSDACRKYFKRHGEIGQSKLSADLSREARKSGQKRTSASASLGNYAGKALIDLAGKLAERQLLPAKSTTNIQGSSPALAGTPLITAAPAIGGTATYRQWQYRPVLPPALQDLLGKLTYPFQILIWGLPGSGKSTFSMLLANALAERFKALYISGEEGLNSTTLRQKQERIITRPEQFLFANRLPNSATEWYQLLYSGAAGQSSGQNAGNGVLAPQNLTGHSGRTTGPASPVIPVASPANLRYRTVVYDSITMLSLQPFYVKATANDIKSPAFSEQLAHIFISHAHKDGKEYRGDGSWGHEVDIIIRCHEGVATVQKNRFATADQGKIGSEYKIY